MSDSFLNRWSRRKAQAHRAAPDDAPAPPAPEAQVPPEAAFPAESEPELSPEEIAALPPVESLTAESDITAFLRKGVPQALRNAALRRMWALDPAIRDFVGEARDYAWDWNAPGGVPGGGPVAGEDVAAMVNRMFSPNDAAPEPGAATPAATRASPRPPGTGTPGAGPTAPGDGGPENGAAGPAGTGSASAEVPPAPEAARADPPAAREPPPARKRRHGGALPA